MSSSNCSKPWCLGEYDTIFKSHALRRGWDKKDWHELRLYAKFLERRSSIQGVEDKPESKEDYIKFQSYCGSYTLASGKQLVIKPNENKLSEEERKLMIEDIVRWSTLLGPNILAQLKVTSPMGEEEACLSYSNMLIDLTESALAEYLPPIIENEVRISPIALGPLDFCRTTQHLSQGETLLVTRKTRLKLECLPLLLLVRFHYEMISALTRFHEFLDKLMMDEENWKSVSISVARMTDRNLSYHSSFLLGQQFTYLVDEALETDFKDPEVLDETLRQSSGSPSLQDITYLWEAYVGRRSLLPLIKEILWGGYTLKPTSKLYELWVLSQLTSQLSEVAEIRSPPIFGRRGSAAFQYEKDGVLIELLYNSTGLSHLLKFKDFFWKLRPDYIITIEKGDRMKQVVLIADAKYKPKPDTSDVENMLAYLLTYGWSEEKGKVQGLLVYTGEKQSTRSIKTTLRSSPNAQLSCLCIRPDEQLPSRQRSLSTLIYTSLNSSN